MRKNYSRDNVMKQLMTTIALLLFCLAPAVTGIAQNKNSVQGDFEALQAFYNATQGNGLPTLSSENELPDPKDAAYPYMYMINGDIYALSKERTRQIGSWYNAGAPWKDKTGWVNMTPETMGDAVGIEVDENGRVTVIDMQKVTTEKESGGKISTGNNLIGELTPLVGNLKKLKQINIKQNFFIGEIPNEIGLLSELERLSLGGSYWEIDVRDNMNARKNWQELEHIQVSYDGDPYTWQPSGKRISSTNNFHSDLPPEIGNLQHLKLIEIRQQYLTGSLPENWGNLSSIRGIFLEDTRGQEKNTLAGEIPSSWGNLETLFFFKLSNYNTHTRFSGSLPQGMLNWSQLSNIAINSNNFSGEFPVFNNLQDMVYFSIADNNFTGEFPWGSIFNGNNARFQLLRIQRNQFSGTLPEAIIEKPSYPLDRDGYRPGVVDLMHNNFEGELPEWLISFDRVKSFSVSGNNFTGSFPHQLANRRDLKTVRLNGNNLSGPLPELDWAAEGVNSFNISDNNFEGEIPESWSSLFKNNEGEWVSKLNLQRFSGNNFSGRIPDWAKHINIHNGWYFHDNKYTFRDILPVYDELKGHLGSDFTIENQKPFGDSMARTMPEGETLILDLSEFDYKGNQYQWTRNGEPIEGANGPSLTITDISNSDEGAYRLEVRNDALPELGTHISEPIYFEIGENDGLNDGSPAGGDEGSSDGGDNGGSTDGGDDGGSTDGSDDGADSASGLVFPSSPIMYSPNDKVENLTVSPQITWSPVEGADYYMLHMSRSNPGGMVIDVTVEDTTYTHPEILGDNALHHWRVRAVKDGEAGEWSGVREFTTTDENHPVMPDIISPDHFTENVSVTPELAWNPVDVDRFNIRIINKETSEVLLSDETEGPTYTPADPLDIETAYIWQVKSIKNGMEGAWSPRWEFTTGEYDYILAAPNLLSPNRNEENESFIPTFEWESVDADLYVITVSSKKPSAAKVLSGNEEDGTVIQEEVAETFYTSEVTLEPETTYYWRVKGIKNSEEGEWSETWEFNTIKENDSETENPGETPLATELKQNYPNPFNPTTQIEFTLDELQNVTLTVYNLMGREVATLVDGVLQAGRHTALFDASSLSSGVYIYRFISDSQQFTKKMTLLK